MMTSLDGLDNSKERMKKYLLNSFLNRMGMGELVEVDPDECITTRS